MTDHIKHAPGELHEVRGKRLWVEQAGEGEPLMLLAGLGPAGSHAIFHPHFDDLHNDFRVIYVDLCGRGRSDKPDDLTDITFEQDVLDITALIERICPNGAHLFGFSYGGLISLKVALDRPDLARSLILCNSLHSPDMWQKNHENINKVIEHQLPELWAQISRLRGLGERSTSPQMQALFAKAATVVRFYNPENANRLLTEPGSRNTELYPVFCGVDVDFNIGGQLLDIPDFRPFLKDLKIPTKVLAGRYDRALYPLLQLDFNSGPVELEFLDRSGSFSFIEETEKVLRLVKAHCRIKSGCNG
ncbi:alpha/beta hydrolase [Pseudomonas sp. 10B1]|uniref:alpha/beta fold hydrolase n=1 Tax=unclassified Pseudomonas TaxID=196821 RepID=UPI002AB5623F|nr:MULTISPECIES: alpha/beta hydrolase [unclassified Pseudomonas]MDY7562385.1 alpha/beta hydrolase [Pseudomonas sp. AB6]MEA9977995.1 alpha/beta hydrolase [Pseudomonas sp. RTS4]MEA9994690.1 alpha/beta hydrolase [Pseudomonas sp. AA4]MEB0086353.1 alpha/beta hydrolase [Pseudomonas sp. RTI1]MEB0126448.1 alpha/beta hydrolase [Pseudomonas sp. CCC1.2]